MISNYQKSWPAKSGPALLYLNFDLDKEVFYLHQPLEKDRRRLVTLAKTLGTGIMVLTNQI